MLRKEYAFEYSTEKERAALFLTNNPEGDAEGKHGNGDLDLEAHNNNNSHSNGKLAHDDDDDDVKCGIGGFHPRCLQGCATIGVFTAIFGCSGIVTSALNIFLASQITSLEKQFNFSSGTSGFLLSCNDIGYLVTTLVFSYFARRVHIPRVLALSTVVYGLSGVVCTLAYFTTRSQIETPTALSAGGEDVPGKKYFTQVCDSVQTLSSNATCEELSLRTLVNTEISSSSRFIALVILSVGMILQGVAKSPRYPYMATYVDDNVPKVQTTQYLGIIVGMAIFGPAMAFMLGGMFSRIYVTLEDTDITQRDPRWIGAWWLGFLAFGSLGILMGVPLIFFPNRMKRRGQQYKEKSNTPIVRKIDSKVDSKIDSAPEGSVKKQGEELIKSMLRLLTNPVYFPMVLSIGFGLMGLSGFISFSPKYLETQFTVPASKANFVFGGSNIVAASLGSFLGGQFVTRFKLSPRACLIYVIAAHSISTGLTSLGMVLGCDQPQIYGDSLTDISQCQSACNCDHQNFFPVCGYDNRNYFSPCHAGCTVMEGSTTFLHCSCLIGSNHSSLANMTSESTPSPLSLLQSSTSSSSSSSQSPSSLTDTAKAGLCEPDCGNFYPYVVSALLSSLVGASVIMPSFVVYIRAVEERDKPLCLGLSAFLKTLIGWFPGPVISGLVVDTTCKIWKSTGCGNGTGACSLYDLPLFRFRFLGTAVALRGLQLCICIVIFIFISFSKTFKFQAHKEEKVVEKETNQKKSDD